MNISPQGTRLYNGTKQHINEHSPTLRYMITIVTDLLFFFFLNLPYKEINWNSYTTWL